MEVLALLLLALLLPAIAIAAVICICAALFLTPIILLTLPTSINVGPYPEVVAFTPDGRFAYVGN